MTNSNKVSYFMNLIMSDGKGQVAHHECHPSGERPESPVNAPCDLPSLQHYLTAGRHFPGGTAE